MTRNASASGTYIEHRIARDGGSLYAREYSGNGPAMVLMHGFPDHLHIWNELVPFLIQAGRRVVTFDFLGFGASDKPADFEYSFREQLGDLEAVVTQLELGRITPVGHDASGFAAVNYALGHPDGVEEVIMLNSVYADIDVHWPEVIDLFANSRLLSLANDLASSPEQLAWLFGWQTRQFGNALPNERRAYFDEVTRPLVLANFAANPSPAPAFLKVAADFVAEIGRSVGRLPELESLDVPFKLIWGKFDPYLTEAIAEERSAHLARGKITILPGGHWVQSDLPEEVAKAMLA